MKIIILGAGEIGRQLATTLAARHNIVVIDHQLERLNKVRDRLDVMTVQGECSSFGILKKAGIENADLLVAATSNEAANILACRVAKHFNAEKTTVCRLMSGEFFCEEEGFTADAAGIDHVIFPEEECVRRIMGVLASRCVVENVEFNLPGVHITALRIALSSPLVGVKISEFPDPELISQIRFSAIVRDNKLMVPHGGTVFAPFDEVYIAGSRSSIKDLILLADPADKPTRMVIVAGATSIGKLLAFKLLADGYDVRMIEKDHKAGEEAIEESGARLMVINGDPTDGDVLDEAGVSGCDVFISALDGDEDNILSCILAKARGADKVVSVTNKAEYESIVPTINTIDSGFSPRLVAVNSVLNLLGDTSGRVQSILHRVNAYVCRFEVQAGSKVCDRKIADNSDIPSSIFSFVFRDGQMLPATGVLVLKEGDIVTTITSPDSVRLLEPLFSKKGFWGV